MGEWKKTRLADLVDIKHGFAFQGEYFSSDGPGDLLMTPGNFAVGGGFKWGKPKYYAGPVNDDYVLHTGDLVVTMTDLSKAADTLGYAAVVPSSNKRLLHNQRIGKVIKRSECAEMTFLHWLMRSQKYRNEVLASLTGSTVKHTSPTKILAFEFLLPPLDEQRLIASILGALDDKIELNRRMNETLEAMARAIFKDWFVDFGPTRTKMAMLGESPGKEDVAHAPYLAPSLWSLFPGRLDDEGKPEGWLFGTLGEISIQAGETVKPEALDPNTPYIGLEHVPRKSVALTEWGSAGKVSSGKLAFRRGDFLFGKLRPYFHKVAIAPIDGICSTDIVVLNARHEYASAFVLACISQDQFVAFTDRTSSGTKMPRTSFGQMERFKLCIPGEPAIRAFNELTMPMLNRIVENIHESRTLAVTRDLLLPKLMSGEIRVKDAEAQLGDVL